MKLVILNPCYEDWNSMTAQGRGRHCQVCSKVVVDFTKMSDEEILRYLSKNKNENTCGHFRSSQVLHKQGIEIDVAKIPKATPVRSIIAACLNAVFSSLFFISCMGKAKKNDGFDEHTIGTIAIIDSSENATTDTVTNQQINKSSRDTSVRDLLMGEVCMDTSKMRGR